MSEQLHGVRLDRVETEMGGLKADMAGLKADVRSLGGVLGRIEDGILRAQEKDDKRVDRARPNIAAVVSILISLIFTFIAGAWTIGNQLGRLDERSAWVQQQLSRNEQRLWQLSHVHP